MFIFCIRSDSAHLSVRNRAYCALCMCLSFVIMYVLRVFLSVCMQMRVYVYMRIRASIGYMYIKLLHVCVCMCAKVYPLLYSIILFCACMC